VKGRERVFHSCKILSQFAILFVFDVEVIFLYPWAIQFFKELGMEGMNGHIYGSPFFGRVFSTSSKESIEWE
jgi:NADH:ubiquinone oxidoreductase subunit 3 (subunit A)